MEYFEKYIKYKKKYIEKKNLYGGFNEYDTIKSQILDDVFNKLEEYKKNFLKEYSMRGYYIEYQSYLKTNYDKEYDLLTKIKALEKKLYYIIIDDTSTINDLIDAINIKDINIKDKFFNSIDLTILKILKNRYGSILIKDIESSIEDKNILKIISNIFNDIKKITSYINNHVIILLKEQYSITIDKKIEIKTLLIKKINDNIELFNDTLLNYIKKIEDLKVHLDKDNIKYKDIIIDISTSIQYLNFYKNFILLLNFIITHNIYCMLNIFLNISLTVDFKIPYLESIKKNRSNNLQRSLSKDINISELLTKKIFDNAIKVINNKYYNLFTDGHSPFNSFYSKYLSDNSLLISKSRIKDDDHFTWHPGNSGSIIGNSHYKNMTNNINYKLFFLLDSINTRTFCFKSVTYIHSLPIYDINDFKYLLLLIYYLKYILCVKYTDLPTKYQNIFNLSDELIFFDINKIDIKQYELFF
jgi:hypothetical protein